MPPTHDLVVKVGEYEQNGQMKGRYLNIGTVMDKGDGGGPFILLKTAFISTQLFMLANKERRDSIIVSIYAKDKDGGKTGSAQPASAPPPDDDIPF
tara:strand:- start:731 stop:1018 length:288 start_codon:yes stop_codon:yes gene_type:complete